MSRAASFLDGRVMLHAGDCLDVLDTLEPESIDSVVCDPPYHLTSIVKRFAGAKPETETFDMERAPSGYGSLSRGFMGKIWDGGDIAFRPELWAKVLRVLKPGGYLVAFSGTRTYHRMACAIEDAGFDIRDQLAYCYGTGFPKSHSINKAAAKNICRCGAEAIRQRDLRPVRDAHVQGAMGGATYRKRHGNYVSVRYVRCPAEFASMARTDGYVMEHRLVMAIWVKRPLLRVECVHHLDHKPLNNPRTNLELWPDNRSHKLAEHGKIADGAANRLFLTD